MRKGRRLACEIVVMETEQSPHKHPRPQKSRRSTSQPGKTPADKPTLVNNMYEDSSENDLWLSGKGGETSKGFPLISHGMIEELSITGLSMSDLTQMTENTNPPSARVWRICTNQRTTFCLSDLTFSSPPQSNPHKHLHRTILRRFTS